MDDKLDCFESICHIELMGVGESLGVGAGGGERLDFILKWKK